MRIALILAALTLTGCAVNPDGSLRGPFGMRIGPPRLSQADARNDVDGARVWRVRWE